MNDNIFQANEEKNIPDNNIRTQNHSENEKRMYDFIYDMHTFLLSYINACAINMSKISPACKLI